jgi:hypothetical protein
MKQPMNVDHLPSHNVPVTQLLPLPAKLITTHLC